MKGKKEPRQTKIIQKRERMNKSPRTEEWREDTNKKEIVDVFAIVAAKK